MKDRLSSLLIASVLMLCMGQAQAVLEIEITRGVEGALPIAIVPFARAGGRQGETQGGDESISSIIESDLARSGLFEVVPQQDFPQRPASGNAINYQRWRSQGVENLAIGSVSGNGDVGSVVQFQLFDLIRGRQSIGYSIPASKRDTRAVAHKISDLIFKKLTGIRGAFSTRIAYISTQRGTQGASQGNKAERRYVLQVADSDGHNARTIFSSAKQLLSPAWSPDGQRIAYVSFENRRPEVFIQDIVGGSRTKVSSKPGINSAPAWSPDGRRLALALSKDGNMEIYVLDMDRGTTRRLTHSSAIDTEPSWMPDGRSLVFTSDRSGHPQLYRVAVDGGRAERLTFEGRYNAAADISPGGDQIALVHNSGKGFRIAVLEMASGRMQVLTKGRLDEAPSFSPNGSMIIYATEFRDNGVLAAVSEDGRVRQRLTLQEGDVREPVWSPFRQ